MRRQRFFIQVIYDTPRAKLEVLVAEIKQLIADHPLTNKTNFHVRFNDFGNSCRILNILIRSRRGASLRSAAPPSNA